jgi:hypothetical protein
MPFAAMYWVTAVCWVVILGSADRLFDCSRSGGVSIRNIGDEDGSFGEDAMLVSRNMVMRMVTLVEM